MRTIIALVVALCVTAAFAQPLFAQKTQKKDAPAAPQTVLKDVLVQHVGKTTNLGVLKRITGDYFVMEEEGGVTAMHPLSTIHTLRLFKDEETGEMQIEIRLVAKD